MDLKKLHALSRISNIILKNEPTVPILLGTTFGRFSKKIHCALTSNMVFRGYPYCFYHSLTGETRKLLTYQRLVIAFCSFKPMLRFFLENLIRSLLASLVRRYMYPVKNHRKQKVLWQRVYSLKCFISNGSESHS